MRSEFDPETCRQMHALHQSPWFGSISIVLTQPSLHGRSFSLRRTKGALGKSNIVSSAQGLEAVQLLRLHGCLNRSLQGSLEASLPPNPRPVLLAARAGGGSVHQLRVYACPGTGNLTSTTPGWIPHQPIH